MPVSSRKGSAMSLAIPCSETARPPDCRLCRALKTVSPASSTRLFHSPHSSHCPCQRKATDPHCWQTYFFFTFAIASALSEHMRNTRENMETERTRSDERRGGNAGVSRWRPRWAPVHQNKKYTDRNQYKHVYIKK